VITRWVRAPIGADGRPQGFDHATMGFRLDFGDGTGLYEVEFNSMEQLAAAQAGADGSVPDHSVVQRADREASARGAGVAEFEARREPARRRRHRARRAAKVAR
jgi:hypothetical protein